ncbi:hypothetical protein TNCV_3237421 [Trichonephila clavipes]|nr:hypothetical protein TNCV_3237421 [Trichonephila clavipes]
MDNVTSACSGTCCCVLKNNFQPHGLQPSCRYWSLSPASKMVCPFACIQQERLDIEKMKTSVKDTTRMEGVAVLFSVESKCTKQSDSRRAINQEIKWTSSLSTLQRKKNKKTTYLVTKKSLCRAA